MAVSASRFRWDDMPKEKVTDLLDRRLITGERMMLAHVYLKKGCIVPRHQHENEQITVHPRRGAALLARRDEPSEELVVRAGEVLRHSLEPAAQGGGAGGHARPRRLLPAAPGLARRDGRLPAAEVAWTSGCGARSRWWRAPARAWGAPSPRSWPRKGARCRCARAGRDALEAARDAIAQAVRRPRHRGGRRRRAGGRERVASRRPPSTSIGRVDILVTNAGGPPSGPFESHDEAAWQAAVRLTLLTAVEMSRARAARA